MKNYIFTVQNTMTAAKTDFNTVSAISKYFKENYNYKIPNYLYETLKNSGDNIFIDFKDNHYIVSRRDA